MVTQARQWKTKGNTGEHVLELPSGNECKIRAVKPEAFLESGLIPDPLTSMIQQAIQSKKGLPPQKVAEVSKDPKKLAAAMEMFDRVLVYTVIEPEVEMPPLCIHGAGDDSPGCGQLYTGGNGVHVDRKHPDYHKYIEADRDPDVLYADVVDMEDKQFIFQFCVGGVADIAKFREERGRALESVQASQGVRKPAKRTAKRK